MGTLKQYGAPQQLTQYAPHRPHIYGFGVVTLRQDDFRCSVPTSDNVACVYMCYIYSVMKLV